MVVIVHFYDPDSGLHRVGELVNPWHLEDDGVYFECDLPLTVVLHRFDGTMEFVAVQPGYIERADTEYVQ